MTVATQDPDEGGLGVAKKPDDLLPPEEDKFSKAIEAFGNFFRRTSRYFRRLVNRLFERFGKSYEQGLIATDSKTSPESIFENLRLMNRAIQHGENRLRLKWAVNSIYKNDRDKYKALSEYITPDYNAFLQTPTGLIDNLPKILIDAEEAAIVLRENSSIKSQLCFSVKAAGKSANVFLASLGLIGYSLSEIIKEKAEEMSWVQGNQEYLLFISSLIAAFLVMWYFAKGRTENFCEKEFGAENSLCLALLDMIQKSKGFVRKKDLIDKVIFPRPSKDTSSLCIERLRAYRLVEENSNGDLVYAGPFDL